MYVLSIGAGPLLSHRSYHILYYIPAWIIRLQFCAITTTSSYENDVTWFCIGKNCGILLTFTTYSVWLLPHQQLMLRRTKKEECFHTLFANTLPPKHDKTTQHVTNCVVTRNKNSNFKYLYLLIFSILIT